MITTPLHLFFLVFFWHCCFVSSVHHGTILCKNAPNVCSSQAKHSLKDLIAGRIHFPASFPTVMRVYCLSVNCSEMRKARTLLLFLFHFSENSNNKCTLDFSPLWCHRWLWYLFQYTSFCCLPPYMGKVRQSISFSESERCCLLLEIESWTRCFLGICRVLWIINHARFGVKNVNGYNMGPLTCCFQSKFSNWSIYLPSGPFSEKPARYVKCKFNV